MTTELLRSARQIIAELPPLNAGEQATRDEFQGIFRSDDAPLLHREQSPTHATASCFVFDPDRQRTLLVFHRKGQFWVQPGGHLEDDDETITSAAVRELLEETGARPTDPIAPIGFDLDHHQLASGFGRCSSHLDFGVALTLDTGDDLTVSDESEDVRWWPIAELPPDSAPGLDRRVSAILVSIENHANQ